MKKGIDIGLIYAGVVIGAGFASGRELWRFFGRFGSYGILGLAVAFLLYLALGYAMFFVIGEEGIKNGFSAFLRSKTITFINFCFMFVLLSAMIAAAGSMGMNIFGVRRWLGGLVFCVFIYICISKGEKGLLSINGVMTPLIIILGVVCGLMLCSPSEGIRAEAKGSISHAVVSGAVYVSYNILSLPWVMLPFKRDLSRRSVRLAAAFSGSFFMLILGVCLFSPVVVYYNLTDNADLPVLGIIGARAGGIPYGIYAAVLFLAVFTTAVGNYFGLCKMSGGRSMEIPTLLAAYLCSLQGFGGIIDTIYPAFGILGLLNIGLIVYNYIKIRYKPHKSYK